MTYMDEKDTNPLFFIFSAWLFAFMTLLSINDSWLAFFLSFSLLVISLVLGFTRSLECVSKMNDRFRFLYFFLALFNIVIFQLMLISTPRVHGPTNKGPDIKNRALANALALSVISYKSHYGSVPWDSSDTDKTFAEFHSPEYDELLEVLSCIDGPDQGQDITMNEKHIRFIEPTRYYQDEGFLDAHGNRFKVILDSDRDNHIRIGKDNIEAMVLVYSFGKNGKDDQGKKDDICSWK